MFQLMRSIFFVYAFGAAALAYVLIGVPQHYTMREFLTFALALFALALAESAVSYLRRYLMRYPPTLWEFLIEFGGLLAVGAVMFFSAAGLMKAFAGIGALVESPSARVVAFPGLSASIVFGVGFTLFFVRRKLRSMYGTVEVMVGVLVALMQSLDVVSTGHPIDGRFWLALMTAGAYLVVRGLDNLEQGLTATPKDPVARVIRRFLRTRIERTRVERRARTARLIRRSARS